MSDNIAVVQSIYAAFGRGDVPAILAACAPDVDWEYGQQDGEVPYLVRQRGREGVARFFGALAETLRIDRFVVKELLAGDGLVVALIDIEGVSLLTGRTLREEDEVHLWRFDAAGKVARFRHALDSAQHERVHRR
jgi:hypothetical protein